MDTWQNIIFQGTYDGAGHTITYRRDKYQQALFVQIKAQSANSFPYLTTSCFGREYLKTATYTIAKSIGV